VALNCRADLEAAERADPFADDLETIDPRCRWALTAQREHMVDILGRTLQDRFDRAIEPIADPPHKAKVARVPLDKCPVADALDAARYADVHSSRLWLVHAWP